MSSNYPPRSIVRESTLTQSDACTNAMNKRDTKRQMINHIRVKKAVHGWIQRKIFG